MTKNTNIIGLVEGKSSEIVKGYHPFGYQSGKSQKLNCRLYIPQGYNKKRKYPLVKSSVIES